MASNEDLDEFVRLSLTDSYYAKVVFQDVKDFYAPDQDLRCTYNAVTDSVHLDGDKIALYKVGWSSVLDYVVAVPCQEPDKDDGWGKNKELNVVFQASTLPKDEGEFYQFCYITKDGDIRGGSTPFLFKSSSPDDIVSVEDIENDVLLIQTRTTIMEQRLQNSMKEKSKLILEKQILANNLQLLKTHIAKLEDLLQQKTDAVSEVNNKLAVVERDTNKKVSLLEEEITQNQHFINGLRTALTTFGKDKDEIDQHMKTVLEDREKLKELVKVLESRLDSASKTERALKDQVHAMTEENRSLTQSLTSKSTYIQQLDQTVELQKTTNNSLSTHLIDTESMLAAMATSKALAAQELQKHLEKQAEMEICRKTMETRHAELVLALATKDNQIHDLESKLKDKEVVNERLIAENVKLLEEKAVVQGECEKLKNEVKDFHERILLGAEEYRQKYLEWHKVNRNYIKLQQKIQSRLSKSTFTPDPPETSVVLEMGDSSTCEGASASEAVDNVNARQVAFWNVAPNGSVQEPGRQERNEAATKTEVTLPLKPEQKAQIFNEMVNQLHKFQSSSNSVSGGSTTDENPDVAAPTTEPYPYPAHYPYPYPQTQVELENPTQFERENRAPQFERSGVHRFDDRHYVEDNESSYEFVNQPERRQSQPQPPNVPELFIRPSPWPPYSGGAAAFQGSNSAFIPLQVPDAFSEQYFRDDRYVYGGGDAQVRFQEMTEEHGQHQGNTRGYNGYPAAPERINEVAPFANVVVRCPICCQNLRRDEDINEHLDGHLYLQCPVCSRQFDRETDGFERFNSHVVGHLD